MDSAVVAERPDRRLVPVADPVPEAEPEPEADGQWRLKCPPVDLSAG
ncbi:hypothetical protein GCM10012285_60560 [Streptomyces kronopolitis]|uniref:Uncharacterized protein n=1 Tax=Streptomyces kronopolitis TaxID=1612435 RepID=A0ABQ2K0M2_9ACTN|nr:hypothetical protein GCM10012285_60560 [Streptomyces kronopolitis]